MGWAQAAVGVLNTCPLRVFGPLLLRRPVPFAYLPRPSQGSLKPVVDFLTDMGFYTYKVAHAGVPLLCQSPTPALVYSSMHLRLQMVCSKIVRGCW